MALNQLTFDLVRGRVRDTLAVQLHGAIDSLTRNFQTIWPEGGEYTPLDSSKPLTLSSTSANDTAEGSGVREVEIYVLDADGNFGWGEDPPRFPLNGQTPVPLPSGVGRVLWVEATSAGNKGNADGSIYVGTGTVTAGKPADINAVIPPDGRRSSMCRFSVPKGYAGLVVDAGAGVDAGADPKWRGDVVVHLLTGRPDLGLAPSPFAALDAQFKFDPSVPWVVDELADIEMRAKADTTAAIRAYLNIVLVKQPIDVFPHGFR